VSLKQLLEPPLVLYPDSFPDRLDLLGLFPCFFGGSKRLLFRLESTRIDSVDGIVVRVAVEIRPDDES
jgi:hypothetical protein